jgi:hypothetical protein
MTPDEAAPTLIDFAEKLDMGMSGKFWAPSEYIKSTAHRKIQPLLSAL